MFASIITLNVLATIAIQFVGAQIEVIPEVSKITVNLPPLNDVDRGVDSLRKFFYLFTFQFVTDCYL